MYRQHSVIARRLSLGLLLALSLALNWNHEAKAAECSWRFRSLFERREELSASQRIENYLQAGKRQEAAYLLRKSGNASKADLIEKDIERTLKTSRILKTEKLSSSNGANASDPVLVTFEDGTQAIRKSGASQVANVNSEVLAYEIDKVFGRAFGVPVTTARDVDGSQYSFQYFVGDTKSTGSRSKNLNFFDYVLDNTDRHSRNILLLQKEGMEVPIDHGLGLRTVESKEKGWHHGVDWSRLLGANCSSWGMKSWKWYAKAVNVDCMAKLLVKWAPDRSVYERFKTVSNEQWRTILSRFLKSSEIDAFLKRRQFFIETLDREIKADRFHFGN